MGLAPMYGDPEVMRYVGVRPHAHARRRPRARCSGRSTRWAADGFGLFTALRKEDDALIGRVGLIRRNTDTVLRGDRARVGDTGPTELEVGYTIGRPCSGARATRPRLSAAARDFALERARRPPAGRADHPRQRRLRERRPQARLRVRTRRQVRPPRRAAVRARAMRLDTRLPAARRAGTDPHPMSSPPRPAVRGRPRSRPTTSIARGAARLPEVTPEELRETLGVPLPEGRSSRGEVVEELAAAADPAWSRSASGRYFGFVIGGGAAAALAADWLASAWDQNAGLYAAGRRPRWSSRSRAMARRAARPARATRRSASSPARRWRRHGARRRALPRAREAGWDVGARRADRRAARCACSSARSAT